MKKARALQSLSYFVLLIAAVAQARLLGAALNHPSHVGAAHRLVGESPGLAQGGAEKRSFLVAGDPRGLDVSVEVSLGFVVGGNLVDP